MSSPFWAPPNGSPWPNVSARRPRRAIGAGVASIGGVTESVKLHALLGVAQDRVGLLHLLELVGGVFVPWTNIGVIFARELLVSLADLFGGGVSADAQRLVKIDFGHEKTTARGAVSHCRDGPYVVSRLAIAVDARCAACWIDNPNDNLERRSGAAKTRFPDGQARTC